MQLFKGRYRLSKTLITYTLMFSSMVTLLATSFQLYLDYTRDIAAIHSQMRQIRDIHLRSITASLWALDMEQLRVQIDDLSNLPDMKYLAVLTDGTPLVSAGRESNKNVISTNYPLEYVYNEKNVLLGTLHAIATLEQVYQRLLDKAIVILGAQAVKTFLVSAFIFLLFQNLVTRHLVRMSDYTRKLALKSLQPPLQLERPLTSAGSFDELDHVVNALNEMRENLRKSYQDLELEHTRRVEAERMAAVGEVSANIAHEIRNPLASIINGLAILDRKNILPDERVEVISLVDTETQRLQRILDDFLQFSRQVTPVLQDGNLSELIEQVVDAVKLSVPDSVCIKFQIDKDETPVRAKFDSEQLQQVLWNLLLNAVQAMPHGGNVTFSTACSNGMVHIRITDDGEGIMTDMHEKVMEPFYSERSGGTGLGLSIAQRIIADHGGKLKIEHAANDRGTSMSFSLCAATT